MGLTYISPDAIAFMYAAAFSDCAMTLIHDHNEMVDACLLAAERVSEHGSAELQAAMRLVLFVLGQDIARQQERDIAANEKPCEP